MSGGTARGACTGRDQQLGAHLARIVTYDGRLAGAAKDLGWRVTRTG